MNVTASVAAPSVMPLGDGLAALGPFLDPVAVGIVLGGTILAVVLRSPVADLWRAVAALGTLLHRGFEATPLVEQTAALARIARRHGLLALDRSVIDDPDMAAAVAAAVDNARPDEVETLLAQHHAARAERHAAAAAVWEGAAEAAPAMGMVGTLIGLVQMFMKMQDPTAIGGAMAVALLTTLYGAVLANLVAMPIAARLGRLAAQEARERLRLIAPLAALADIDRARVHAGEHTYIGETGRAA